MAETPNHLRRKKKSERKALWKGQGEIISIVIEFQDSRYVGVILLQIRSYSMMGCITLNSDLFLTGELSVPKIKELEER